MSVVSDDMEPDDLNDSDRALLDVLHDGRCTPGALEEWTGLSKQTVHSRLRALVAAGHVEKVHSGLYELVDDPRKSGKEAHLISLTDDQLDAVASNDVAVIDTERLRYLVVHADHQEEALDVVQEGEADVVVREVTKRD